MRRLTNILLLHFLDVFESRSRAFVWFLTTILYPMLLLLFWQGVKTKTYGYGWNSTSISSYYFSLTIAFSLLISHIEEQISQIDIREGMLAMYLMRPISYFWKKFFEELPYKLLQGSYGFIFCLLVILIVGKNIFTFTNDYFLLAFGIILLTNGLMLSFSLKMIMGILTFWFLDIRGFYELIYMIEMIFSGLLMPIILLPAVFYRFAIGMPFAYIVYYPLGALQGHLTRVEAVSVFFVQCFWLLASGLLYHVLWKQGVKRFSGVGQ